MKITADSIKTLPTPTGDDAVYWDQDIGGFGVRVRPTGGRSFIFKYRVKGDRKVRRLTIGDAGPDGMKAGVARETAKGLRALVQNGKDPQRDKIEDRAKRPNTFGAMVPKYLDYKTDKVKPRTHAAAEHALDTLCKDLHGARIDKVGRSDLAGVLAKIESKRGPSAKARTYAVLSDFFGWALAVECVIEANPLATIRKPGQGEARDRVLEVAELAAVWNACEDDDFGRIARLLILTLQRRDEIGAAAWVELDRDAAALNLPGSRTKNHRDHMVPLAPAALALFEQQLPADGKGPPRDLIFGQGKGGFSGWSKAKAALDERIEKALGKPLAPWTLHDLRRTGATMMAETLNVQPHIIEAILNHVSGHKAGVAGVYNRATYAAEKKTALARWAEHVDSIVNGRASNVITLKSA